MATLSTVVYRGRYDRIHYFCNPINIDGRVGLYVYVCIWLGLGFGLGLGFAMICSGHGHLCLTGCGNSAPLESCKQPLQLSELQYCNVLMKTTCGDVKSVRCLKDSGAQISRIQKDLIKDVDPHVLGTVTIKGVIGQPAEATLVTTSGDLETVAAKLVNGPWCKKNRWAPYSPWEKFHYTDK